MNGIIIPTDTIQGPIGGYIFLTRINSDLTMHIHYMDPYDCSSDDTIERLKNYDTPYLSYNGITDPEQAMKKWLLARYIFNPSVIVKLQMHPK